MLAPVFAICYTLDSRYVRPTLVLVVRLRKLCGLNFLDRSIADLALNSRESKLDIPASIPPGLCDLEQKCRPPGNQAIMTQKVKPYT